MFVLFSFKSSLLGNVRISVFLCVDFFLLCLRYRINVAIVRVIAITPTIATAKPIAKPYPGGVNSVGAEVGRILNEVTEDVLTEASAGIVVDSCEGNADVLLEVVVT